MPMAHGLPGTNALGDARVRKGTHRRRDRILGFTALGVEASEMMAVVQTAMLGRLPYTALRDAIFTHPTAAEGLIGLFSNTPAALNRGMTFFGRC